MELSKLATRRAGWSPVGVTRNPNARAIVRVVRMASSEAEFDTKAYDEERLKLDGQARAAMVVKETVESEAEEVQPGSKAGPEGFRRRRALASPSDGFPRPVHNRIPNFVDADKAADLLSTLPEFQAAAVVKVNPDTPQKRVRYNVLHSAGAAKYGCPLDLDAKIKVDLIVVGSSAVDVNGARLGKGEGFAELEYGMLRWMGAIDDNTLVITTVHDCQVIHTNSKIPKPPGILWHKLSPEKLGQIRVLRNLKSLIEKETGEKLPTGPSEMLPPIAKRTRLPRKPMQ
eukprot:gene18500-24998_t